MEQYDARYEIEGFITVYYSEVGTLIYLEDKTGKQLARVEPVEGLTLSSLYDILSSGGDDDRR